MDLPFWKFTKEVGGVGVKKGPRKITCTLGSIDKLPENSYLVLKVKVKKIIKFILQKIIIWILKKLKTWQVPLYF